ncbi:GNAT family N-acetyltransferase [Halobaculum sp. MBLA0143]|uniref:GNAT family N-acetyltransferase n=1 Tax=Halobaculum sp. MBLA0143 TaxID=3079933 RepID=UPI0035248FB3
MFPELIETDRLRLERMDRALGARQFYAAAGAGQTTTIDRETEFLSWEPHDHPKESADVLADFTEKWDDHEWAGYVVIPREGEPYAGLLAGNAALGPDWDRRRGTLGVWLRKPFWGRGYSGERARALAALAFERLDLEIVSVDVLPDNEQSVRAIEKYVESMGGRREGRFRNEVAVGGEPHDTVSFSVSREEYEATVDEPPATFVDELDEPALEGVPPAEVTPEATTDE